MCGSLMFVGFVHFKSQALKNSRGQNNGGFDRVGWHHNVCKNLMELHCNL
jgi:hypothetical protein